MVLEGERWGAERVGAGDVCGAVACIAAGRRNICWGNAVARCKGDAGNAPHIWDCPPRRTALPPVSS